jgi:hypothetical protein
MTCEPIFRSILVPQRQLIRLPLAEWATSIREKVDCLLEASHVYKPSIVRELVSCFNQAALVEVYFGRFDRAAMLCESALIWLALARLGRPRDRLYEVAFQPYINMGRLARVRGLWADSLAKFQTVYSVLQGEPVLLGPIDVPPYALEEDEIGQELDRTLRTVFIVDSLKTLLRAGMYDAAVAFALDHIAVARDTVQRQCLIEGHIVGLSALGACNKALQLTETLLHDKGIPNRPVFVFRQAEALTVSKDTARALRVATPLVQCFLQYKNTLSQDALLLLLSFTKLLGSLSSYESVRALAEIGYRSATQRGDVVLRCNFLEVTAEHGASAIERRTSESMLEQIRNESWYGAARTINEGATTSSPFTILNDLFERLVVDTLPRRTSSTRFAPGAEMAS